MQVALSRATQIHIPFSFHMFTFRMGRNSENYAYYTVQSIDSISPQSNKLLPKNHVLLCCSMLTKSLRKETGILVPINYSLPLHPLFSNNRLETHDTRCLNGLTGAKKLNRCRGETEGTSTLLDTNLNDAQVILVESLKAQKHFQSFLLNANF